MPDHRIYLRAGTSRVANLVHAISQIKKIDPGGEISESHCYELWIVGNSPHLECRTGWRLG